MQIEPGETIAYLGLGSNEGDRAAALEQALVALERTPGVRLLRRSTWVETELVGDGPAQGTFLNGVAELATRLAPVALLAICKELERAAGRTLPAARNHPRPLDLDVLAHGSVTIDSRELTVPHREWHRREFVTAPLAELGVDTATWRRWEPPQVLGTAAGLAALTTNWRTGGCSIGLVPTMGALHAGHRSLIDRARRECDRVAVTIFVNPLQFGAGEDLAAYPRGLERDVALCREAGADAVFTPSPEAMYDPGFASRIRVGHAASGMEGAERPEHFEGVATVVAKLLAIARPDRAYFGEKDAQQLAVIRRLVRDLGFPVTVVPCAIVREADGLAMSSRNIYLDAADRVASTVLCRALRRVDAAFVAGERDHGTLVQLARDEIATEPRGVIDYVELRSETDLTELPAGAIAADVAAAGVRMLVAVRFARGPRPVRLLDNLRLGAGCAGDAGADVGAGSDSAAAGTDA